MTALTWAAYRGNKQVVDVLLQAGANPNIRDKVIVRMCVCVASLKFCVDMQLP